MPLSTSRVHRSPSKLYTNKRAVHGKTDPDITFLRRRRGFGFLVRSPPSPLLDRRLSWWSSDESAAPLRLVSARGDERREVGSFVLLPEIGDSMPISERTNMRGVEGSVIYVRNLYWRSSADYCCSSGSVPRPGVRTAQTVSRRVNVGRSSTRGFDRFTIEKKEENSMYVVMLLLFVINIIAYCRA